MEGAKYSGGGLSGGYSERLGKRLQMQTVVVNPRLQMTHLETPFWTII